MKLLSPALSRLARLRYGKIRGWMDDPIGAQRHVLQDLITHGQYTAFGRQHGFDKLFNIRSFKEAVPVSEYDNVRPYIARTIEGEANLLWNTPVTWFAKSSGTTSDKSKFIPITEESLHDCHYKAARDVLTMFYHNHPESDLLTGKGLVIGGSHQVSNLNGEMHCGDLSAVLLQNLPFYGRWIRTPELSIALMDEWETKIAQLAESTITENVTSISGVPTWTLVLIRHILDITKASCLLDVWPGLELYIHGGVSFEPYREQFARLIGGNIRYLEMYNASEGFFAAQDDPLQEGMLLFLDHGIFYEFMPVEEYGKKDPQTIGLSDVEIGRQYAPVISTNGGLWRYMTGDTIRFTSTDPYRVKVSGRLKHFINAFGEELIIDNTDRAIAMACERTGCIVNDYTAAPVYFSNEGNGAHEWLIEFEHEPASTDHFIYELDDSLKSLNSDYEAKRHKDIALRMPVVRQLRKGVFSAWLKARGKLGGQHKVPRLSNDRRYVEEILIFMA